MLHANCYLNSSNLLQLERRAKLLNKSGSSKNEKSGESADKDRVLIHRLKLYAGCELL